jgi:hypothetical protein
LDNEPGGLRPLELEPHQWRLRALVASLAGLAFSLTLSAVIVLAEIWGVPGAAEIEQAGVDLTMSVFQSHAWITDPPARPGAAHTRYALIDVDAGACEAFSDVQSCNAKEPIPLALVMAFARAAQASHAKVVVIDWQPNDTKARTEAIRQLQALAASPRGLAGPWMIAPLDSRAEELADATIQETADLKRLESGADGRLRLAAFRTSTDVGGHDGVIRRYPLMTHIDDPSSQADRWLPTAPFLAALLANDATAAAADCRFYRAARSGAPCPASPRLERLAALGADAHVDNKIFYTLPNFSADPDADPAHVYAERYHYIKAGDLLTNGRFGDLSQQLEGRIVVLGSSAPQAEDLHITPIGRMSGPEILLNATRAIAEFSPIEASREAGGWPGLWREIGERVRAALIGLCAFAPAWLVIYWLQRHGKPKGRRAALARGLGATAAFVAALGLALAAEFALEIYELRPSVQAGVLINGLTPVLALGLEGFAEAAKALQAMFEWVAERALLAAPALLLLIRPKPKRPTTED